MTETQIHPLTTNLSTHRCGFNDIGTIMAYNNFVIQARACGTTDHLTKLFNTNADFLNILKEQENKLTVPVLNLAKTLGL
jgi:hypothetical protein